tara:strand:- start:252 stop:476 length:225 start_codon:yes stop_codon:yes gene_type:complete
MAQDTKWTRTIEFTEKQQSVVAEIVLFVNDIGLPDHIDQTVFDEVLEVICDDSPFEWTVTRTTRPKLGTPTEFE